MRRRDFLAATAALLSFPVSRLAAAAPPPRPKMPPLPPKPKTVRWEVGFRGGPADGERLAVEGAIDKGPPRQVFIPHIPNGRATSIQWDGSIVHIRSALEKHRYRLFRESSTHGTFIYRWVGKE